MQLDTKTLKNQIEKDLSKLDELRSRLQARLKAIEIVERTAGDFRPSTGMGFSSALDPTRSFGGKQN